MPFTKPIEAARYGNLDGVRESLGEAKVRGDRGRTALMFAAPRGQTALMYAARGGHGDCVKLLLLERDIKDEEDKTAEDVAISLPEEARKKALSLLETRPRLPLLPEELSSYQITGRLGRGAFGTIFSAWSEEHGNFALKVVEYEDMGDAVIDSLRREMETIPSINHPNVLRYHWVHDDAISDTAYIAMEWCPGTLLDEVRERKERRELFRDEEVWKYLREMAAGLACLHERGLVHRDLKPENVFLAPDGRAVLADFGLIRDATQSHTRSAVAGRSSTWLLSYTSQSHNTPSRSTSGL